MWDLGLVSDLGVWLPGKCGEGMGVLGLVFVFGFDKWVSYCGPFKIQNAYSFSLGNQTER